MRKEIIYQKTNEYGKKFFDSYLKSAELLGIEEKHDSRQEFFVIFRYPNDTIHTCVLPLKESSNNGSCFYGDLEHFAMSYAEQMSGVFLRLNNNGNLMWPWWYHNEEEYKRWYKFYKEMKDKYPC